LDPAKVTWIRYEDQGLGYAISYPHVYSPSASDDGAYVIFRYGRFSPLIIRWVDPQEGRQRGLWFSSKPIEEIEMGGVRGEKFVYTHWDGPFGARMITHVISCKGKYLGVELRSNGELDEVQREILCSVTLSS
jgi:hypothetical protein